MEATPPLPDEARPVLTAYEGMEASKTAHFAYLAEVDARVQGGGQRTLADEARLHTLLAEHDRAVESFKGAILDLLRSAPEAHAAFLRYITTRNAALGEDADTH